MHRVDGGQPLRDAIAATELSIPKLAELTRQVDPKGHGISAALIGFYASTGTSARESASRRTARLITTALRAAGLDLADDAIFTTTASTHAQ